jgi:hypothetical protein
MELIKPTQMLVSNDEEIWVIRLVFAVYPDNSCWAYDAKYESDLREQLINKVAFRPIMWKFKREIDTIEKPKASHKIALLSDGTAECGKRIIEHLKSLGGTQNPGGYPLRGIDKESYYFIDVDNYFAVRPILPDGYELMELPEEEKSYTITKDSVINVGDILIDNEDDTFMVLYKLHDSYAISYFNDYDTLGDTVTIDDIIKMNCRFHAEKSPKETNIEDLETIYRDSMENLLNALNGYIYGK